MMLWVTDSCSRVSDHLPPESSGQRSACSRAVSHSLVTLTNQDLQELKFVSNSRRLFNEVMEENLHPLHSLPLSLPTIHHPCSLPPSLPNIHPNTSSAHSRLSRSSRTSTRNCPSLGRFSIQLPRYPATPPPSKYSRATPSIERILQRSNTAYTVRAGGQGKEVDVELVPIPRKQYQTAQVDHALEYSQVAVLRGAKEQEKWASEQMHEAMATRPFQVQSAVHLASNTSDACAGSDPCADTNNLDDTSSQVNSCGDIPRISTDPVVHGATLPSPNSAETEEDVSLPTYICPSSALKSREARVRNWLAANSFTHANRRLPVI